MPHSYELMGQFWDVAISMSHNQSQFRIFIQLKSIDFNSVGETESTFLDKVWLSPMWSRSLISQSVGGKYSRFSYDIRSNQKNGTNEKETSAGDILALIDKWNGMNFVSQFSDSK